MFLSIAAFILLGAGAVHCQFVPPPTDLITKTGYAGYEVRYKEVPKGICEQSDAKSYSGYVDVSSDQVLLYSCQELVNVLTLEAHLLLVLRS